MSYAFGMPPFKMVVITVITKSAYQILLHATELFKLLMLVKCLCSIFRVPQSFQFLEHHLLFDCHFNLGIRGIEWSGAMCLRWDNNFRLGFSTWRYSARQCSEAFIVQMPSQISYFNLLIIATCLIYSSYTDFDCHAARWLICLVLINWNG